MADYMDAQIDAITTLHEAKRQLRLYAGYIRDGAKLADFYSCLRLDGDKTAGFIADTYSDWDPGEVEWGDFLDTEMERWTTLPPTVKP